jgi:hypothetical protein
MFTLCKLYPIKSVVKFKNLIRERKHSWNFIKSVRLKRGNWVLNSYCGCADCAMYSALKCLIRRFLAYVVFLYHSCKLMSYRDRQKKKKTHKTNNGVHVVFLDCCRQVSISNQFSCYSLVLNCTIILLQFDSNCFVWFLHCSIGHNRSFGRCSLTATCSTG